MKLAFSQELLERKTQVDLEAEFETLDPLLWRLFAICSMLALTHGKCTIKPDLSRPVLERIQEGISRSPHTPNAIKASCKGRF